jgi:hypothetical protein
MMTKISDQKTKRNFVIGGVPRSGKTTVSRRLSKELGISHLPLDALISAFEVHFPEHGIMHQKLTLEEISRNFLPFASTYFEEMEFEGTSFCADSYHILPAGAVTLASVPKSNIIYLGYPRASVRQKLADIRNYAEKDDWTADFGNSEMEPLVQRFIDQSKFIEAECKKHGIPFVDTSTDFEVSLESAFQRLLSL